MNLIKANQDNEWAMERVRLARHDRRPYALDFISRIFTSFSEIHGDRKFHDDPALICGLAKFQDRPVVVIAGNGTYEPVGLVSVNEEAAERAFAGGDTELRYHFNLPANMTPSDQLSFSFDAFNLDENGSDPRWGVEKCMRDAKLAQIFEGTNQLNRLHVTRGLLKKG